MLKSAFIKELIVNAIDLYALEGMETFSERYGLEASLSHVCFKFQNDMDYQEYVGVAEELGETTSNQFGGKEFTWCELEEPIERNGIVLKWLEFVEPVEPNAFNGVTSLGFVAKELTEELVKYHSSDNKILFRIKSAPVHP